MLLSIALIFLCGLTLGSILEKIKLPSLLGYLITGIILGPYVLNLFHPNLLNISADLRQIALIIILTRAGLNLDIGALRKVGRPAILICFVPACFEIIGTLIFAPMLLKISLLDAAIFGCVIAAVSPAVVVPRMIKLKENGYGKSIPELIMAGASVDDVFVIVLFTSFTGLAQGEKINVMDFINIPISIILGVAVGIILGILLSKLFTTVHMRDSAKVIILISISFLLVVLENYTKSYISVSGLLGVITMAITLRKKKKIVAERVSSKFSKLWVCAEILLFVLVGATVNLKYATESGLTVLLLILVVLLFRVVGVFICLIKAKVNIKEKIFCMIAYMPKATVQAGIGSIPLAMGLSCGDIVLTGAVLSILFTAPLGAILIDNTYKRLLDKKNKKIKCEE